MTSDVASSVIDRPATEVFDFMADAGKLDLWSFGTWRIKLLEEGLVHGRTLHNGSSVYVRVLPHPEQQLIDYQVGNTVESMTSRIFARITDGREFGADSNSCLLMIISLRTTTMDDARWQALKDTHAVEVGLIKSLIECGYDHRREPYD
ncbi:hypothetical protein AB833_09400 [Chromatiales bacterium (ex Bugula neritina AB1)]|nr:hypothetical protein AB833_09400 [Chromatiales bacterium (ex Bugula neritina AB1)]